MTYMISRAAGVGYPHSNAMAGIIFTIKTSNAAT